MSTQMVLELKYINSTNVTIHLDVMLLQDGGGSGSYINGSWLNEQNVGDPFTQVGRRLYDQLETLHAVDVMYGQYGFMAHVPLAFDTVDVLFDILMKVIFAVDDDILFATTLGDDAFTKPEFVTNPNRQAFGDNINTMLVELRKRKSRAITEARRTIEEMADILREAQYH